MTSCISFELGVRISGIIAAGCLWRILMKQFSVVSSLQLYRARGRAKEFILIQRGWARGVSLVCPICYTSVVRDLFCILFGTWHTIVFHRHVSVVLSQSSLFILIFTQRLVYHRSVWPLLVVRCVSVFVWYLLSSLTVWIPLAEFPSIYIWYLLWIRIMALAKQSPSPAGLNRYTRQSQLWLSTRVKYRRKTIDDFRSTIKWQR